MSRENDNPKKNIVSELQLLGEIDRQILDSTIDLQQTLTTILLGALKLLKAQYGNVMLLEGNGLVIRATTTNPQEEELGKRLELDNEEYFSIQSVLTRNTIVIPDVEKEPNYIQVLQGERMRSEIVTPLIENGHVVGAINIESPKVHAFSEYEVQLLELLAGQAAIAIKQARNYTRMEALRRIDQAILSSETDLDSTLQLVLNICLDAIGSLYGNLLIVEGNDLIIRATTTPSPGKDAELGTRLRIRESISGLPVLKKEAILIPDVVKEPLYHRILQEEYMRSELAAPIMIDGVPIGVLNIESPRKAAFTEWDLEYLETLAGQTAIAIQHARNQDAFKELRKIDRAMLRSTSSLDSTFHTILEGICRLIDLEYCDIILLEGDELVIKASTAKHLVGIKVDLNNSVSGKAVLQKEPIYVPDITKEPAYFNIPDSPRTRSDLAVPMLTNGKVIGVINVENARRDPYSKHEINLIRTLAGQCALGIKTAQYIEESIQYELIKANGEAANWVTHKIGNAALNIQWPAERLRDEIGSENKSANEELDMIEAAAIQIVELKQALVEPFKPCNIEAVYLVEVVDESIKLGGVQPSIIQLNFADNLPLAKGCFTELSDVISELLMNAVNAMEGVAEKKIELSAFNGQEGECIEIKISDNGCGISAEHLDQIWSLGFTTKVEQGGTGFGLYKCAQLLRKVGANIFVESELGRGTTFTIRLPIWDGNDVAKSLLSE